MTVALQVDGSYRFDTERLKLQLKKVRQISSLNGTTVLCLAKFRLSLRLAAEAGRWPASFEGSCFKNLGMY